MADADGYTRPHSMKANAASVDGNLKKESVRGAANFVSFTRASTVGIATMNTITTLRSIAKLFLN